MGDPAWKRHLAWLPSTEGTLGKDEDWLAHCMLYRQSIANGSLQTMPELLFIVSYVLEMMRHGCFVVSAQPNSCPDDPIGSFPWQRAFVCAMLPAEHANHLTTYLNSDPNGWLKVHAPGDTDEGFVGISPTALFNNTPLPTTCVSTEGVSEAFKKQTGLDQFPALNLVPIRISDTRFLVPSWGNRFYLFDRIITILKMIRRP